MKFNRSMPLVSILALGAAVACGKKDSKSESLKEEVARARPTGEIAIKGKLLLASATALNLADSASRQVALFTLTGDGRVDGIKEIAVETDGTFSVGLSRMNSKAKDAKAALGADGKVNRAAATKLSSFQSTPKTSRR